MSSFTRRAALESGFAVVAGGLAAPYVVRTGFAATPVRTLKLVFGDTLSNPAFAPCLKFAENVKKKTDGAIEVHSYPVGALVPEKGILPALQTGVIDLAFHTSGFIETVDARFNVCDLPFLFSTAEAAQKMYNGPVGTRLLNGLTAKRIYGLSYGWWGWRVIDAIKRPLPEPKDIRGLKVRVQSGAIFSAMYRTLQAIPVTIDITEVYLALSDGTVGALDDGIISLPANKFGEVAKVVTSTNHDYNVGALMASKRSFDRLDKKYQEAVRQAAREASPDWYSTVSQATEHTYKVLSSKGVKIIKADQVDRAAYRKAVEPVYHQFRNIVGSDLMDAVLKAAA